MLVKVPLQYFHISALSSLWDLTANSNLEKAKVLGWRLPKAHMGFFHRPRPKVELTKIFCHSKNLSKWGVGGWARCMSSSLRGTGQRGNLRLIYEPWDLASSIGAFVPFAFWPFAIWIGIKGQLLCWRNILSTNYWKCSDGSCVPILDYSSVLFWLVWPLLWTALCFPLGF